MFPFGIKHAYWKKTHSFCAAPQCGQNEKSIGNTSSQDTHFFSVAIDCPQAGQNLYPAATSLLQLPQIMTVSFLRRRTLPNAFVTLPPAVTVALFTLPAACPAIPAA